MGGSTVTFETPSRVGDFSVPLLLMWGLRLNQRSPIGNDLWHSDRDDLRAGT